MDVRDFGDRLEPRLRQQFLIAVEAARRLVSNDELVALIKTNNRAALHQLATRLVEEGFIPGLAAWLQTVSTVAQAAAISTLTLVGSLTRINQFALDAIRAHGTKQILTMGLDSRQAIIATIDSLMSGTGPTNVAAAARQIRAAAGLHPSHAVWVRNYRKAMEDEGLSPALIEKNVATYERRLIAWRAEAIARTETMTASHMGLVAGWRAAIAEGRLGADALMRWVVTEDDRLCERCAPMDGKTAPIIGGRFVSTHKGFPDGMPTDTGPGSRRQRKTGLKPGSRKRPSRAQNLDGILVELSSPVTVDHPPLHPNCRCTLVLELP